MLRKQKTVIPTRPGNLAHILTPYQSLVPAEGAEIYLFAGPTPMDVIRRYNLLCGGGNLPPRWGLGFTQRTKTRYTADEVLAEADAFEQNGYPLDFIGLEPGWQSKAYPCTFEWDSIRFPNPQDFINKMLDRKVRINLWTNPYVSPDSKIYKECILSAALTLYGAELFQTLELKRLKNCLKPNSAQSTLTLE